MCPASLAAGIAVVDEATFVDRFQDSDQGVVDDAVPEGRCCHQAFLRVVDQELPIPPKPICPVQEFASDPEQLVLTAQLEGRSARPAALAAPRLPVGCVQVLERDDSLE
jgi:hypothetical protein